MSEPAGMWLRVSSSGQDEQSQVPDNKKWIESHDYDHKRTYTIHGKSGFKGNKKFDETWERVLKDIANGVIHVLVVWKQNRLDRKLNTFRMIEQVVKASGRVEFVTQPHLNDLSTMGGRLALKIEEEIAYAESKNKSDAVKAKQAALRAAKSLVGRPPFGYRVEEIERIKTLVPTGEGLKYVPEIFEHAKNGHSLMAIAKWLDSENVNPLIWRVWIRTDPDERGPEPTWSPKTISQIIRRTTYMGERQDAVGMTILEVKPLVTRDRWHDANKTLDAAPKRGKRGPSVNEPALLTGILICARCDSPMYRVYCGGKSSKGSKRVPYYRCHGKPPQPKGCGAPMISAQLAESLVDMAMAVDERFIMTVKFTPGSNHEAEIKQVRLEMRKLANRLAGDELSDEEFDAQMAELRAKRDHFESLPATDDEWEPVPLLENGKPVTYAEKWKSLKGDFAGRVAMLKELKATFEWSEPDERRLPVLTIGPRLEQWDAVST